MHLKTRLFQNLVFPLMLWSLLTFPAVGSDLERATGGIHLRLAFSGWQCTSITISGYTESITPKELRQTFSQSKYLKENKVNILDTESWTLLLDQEEGMLALVLQKQ